MLDEPDYRLLLSALSEPTHFLVRPPREALSGEPVAMDVLVAPPRPSASPVWRRIELAPSDLARIWHDRQPDLQGFSLLVRGAETTRRACVSKCPDGTIQEAFCSDTADDMVNCTELTTLRCGTSRATTGGEFIAFPPGLAGRGRPGEPRRELA